MQKSIILYIKYDNLYTKTIILCLKYDNLYTKTIICHNRLGTIMENVVEKERGFCRRGFLKRRGAGLAERTCSVQHLSEMIEPFFIPQRRENGATNPDLNQSRTDPLASTKTIMFNRAGSPGVFLLLGGAPDRDAVAVR
jgi:hypothetical protein